MTLNCSLFYSKYPRPRGGVRGSSPHQLCNVRFPAPPSAVTSTSSPQTCRARSSSFTTVPQRFPHWYV
ncbi:hypothetical protein E2C01_040597 [Portunus trituberculatus]|uniref:Uncharacterized protein n=1 Tax=Portunus trituberculatus TaxID=210409 RepID=A0A5B7FNF3_PORTR|nr:hypothetical protein [Portunus trituberculatus]